MARAATLRVSFVVQKCVDTKPNSMGEAGRWVDRGQVRGELETLSGRALEFARAAASECTHRLCLRYRIPHNVAFGSRLVGCVERRKTVLYVCHVNLQKRFILLREYQ